MLYFTEGFFSKGFKDHHVVLHKDSELVWYSKQGASKAEGKVNMKVSQLPICKTKLLPLFSIVITHDLCLLQSVCNFLAVGPFTRNIPGRPELPQGTSERHLLAIPQVASRQAEINWFLCKNDDDLKWAYLSTEG